MDGGQSIGFSSERLEESFVIILIVLIIEIMHVLRLFCEPSSTIFQLLLRYLCAERRKR